MATPYEGDAKIDEAIVVSVAIGDLDDPGWLGQIGAASQRPVESLEPGTVTVRLLGGDRDGWTAQAYVDAAGALRGETAFIHER
jgi:hypothetical protein